MGFGSRGTQRKSRGSRQFYLCCGREWAVRKFHWRPAGNGGIWRVIEMASTHEVEKKIKAAVYLTKAKHFLQSQTSGNNSQLLLKKWERVKLSKLRYLNVQKCLFYNGHKSGTSALRRHTYFLSSMCYLFNKLKFFHIVL